jgi:hypothetical protein
MNQGGRANHHGLNAPLRIRQVIKRSILVSSIYIFVLTGCKCCKTLVCITEHVTDQAITDVDLCVAYSFSTPTRIAMIAFNTQHCSRSRVLGFKV